MSRETNRSFGLTCCMSEANNFHSVIYSGHYHRSLLVKKVASLQLVDKEGQEMLHLLTYMYKELLGKEKKNRVSLEKWKEAMQGDLKFL